MGRIVLITRGKPEAADNCTAKGMVCLESNPTSPFWLDLLSPSARLVGRISNAFKFNPWVLRACLSRHREPRCDDFSDYLFIQTSLLEPSRKSLFIQRDIKIILGRTYLITLHASRTPFRCSLSRSQVVELTHATPLLLKLFDDSVTKLLRFFCSGSNRVGLPVQNYQTPQKNPLWWRLRNFRAALLRDANVLHGIAATGVRFLSPDDANIFESVRAKIHVLCDATSRWLSRMESSSLSRFSGVSENISRTRLNGHK
jgi:hypothetical protein